MHFALDYDQLIHLDAEDLAETGILEAYERLMPELRKFIGQPALVDEIIDNDTPRYSVSCGTKDYLIYGPESDVGSWGRATVAFFSIINDQLAGTAYRFYAINGGNDLGGMFLTPTQAGAGPTCRRTARRGTASITNRWSQRIRLTFRPALYRGKI